MSQGKPHPDPVHTGLRQKSAAALADFIYCLAQAPDGLGYCVRAFALSGLDAAQSAQILEHEAAALRRGESDYDRRHRQGDQFEHRLHRYLDTLEIVLIGSHPTAAAAQLASLLEAQEDLINHCFDGEQGGLSAMQRIRDLHYRLTRPRRLRCDPGFVPCEAHDGDELFPNGIFVFNITRLREHIARHPEEFMAMSLDVAGLADFGSERLDPTAVASADTGDPIILAEIAPDSYNLIDGHHRLEAARRRRQDRILAYRIPCRDHLPFLTSLDAYHRYIDYWNSKAGKK